MMVMIMERAGKSLCSCFVFIGRCPVFHQRGSVLI